MYHMYTLLQKIKRTLEFIRKKMSNFKTHFYQKLTYRNKKKGN